MDVNEKGSGAPAAGSALQTWERLRNGECDCAQCQFYKRQIVLAARFNLWMSGGFAVAGVVVIGFLIGVICGWW